MDMRGAARTGTLDDCGARTAGPGLPAVALVALGLGCYLGWQIVDISPTLFPTPGAGVYDAVQAWGYAGTAGVVALLALLGVLVRRGGPLLGRSGLIALAAFGPFAGTAVLYLGGWVAPEPLLPAVGLGRLLFCTSAALVVLWGEALCHVQRTRLLPCVAAGYAVAFGVCLLVAYLEPPAPLVFRTVLPLFSGAALLAVRGELLAGGAGSAVRTPGPASGEGADTGPAARLSTLPVRLFVGIGCLGAIFTVTNHLSETKTDVSTELYTLFAGIAVSLAIWALAGATRGAQGNFTLLYRLVTPLVIGCLLLTLVLQPGHQHYEALAIGFAWAFFRIFTWALWAHIGSRDAARGACVFAFGQIALTLFDTVAELLCTAIVDLSAVPLVAAAAAIILATVVTSAFIMDEGSVARLSDAPAAAGSEGAPARTASLTDAPPASPAPPFDPERVTPDDLARATAALGLSEREREIALLVLRRNGNDAICQAVCITPSTLRTHLRNIYAKVDAHSRQELIDLLERLVRG